MSHAEEKRRKRPANRRKPKHEQSPCPREAVPAVYRAILRRLIDANDEERREHWEMCRDFERDKQPVPKDRAQEGLMLNRRRFLLEALEGCRPDKLHHLLIVLHAPLTEVEDALLEFLSAVWGDDNAR